MASLVADYGSTSSSNSEGESDTENISNSPGDILNEKSKFSPLVNPFRENSEEPSSKLPSPGITTSGALTVKNSVFSNPFVEAENAKKAILEKHVKMTPSKDETTMINGKQICWNYRKGRCRFGHRCKYAHDSDVHRTDEDEALANQQEQVVPVTPSPDDDSVEKIKMDAKLQLPKRKRPGLAQGLVPGKKVMKLYKDQQVKEVPWIITSKTNR